MAPLAGKGSPQGSDSIATVREAQLARARQSRAAATLSTERRRSQNARFGLPGLLYQQLASKQVLPFLWLIPWSAYIPLSKGKGKGSRSKSKEKAKRRSLSQRKEKMEIDPEAAAKAKREKAITHLMGFQASLQGMEEFTDTAKEATAMVEKLRLQQMSEKPVADQFAVLQRYITKSPEKLKNIDSEIRAKEEMKNAIITTLKQARTKLQELPLVQVSAAGAKPAHKHSLLALLFAAFSRKSGNTKAARKACRPTGTALRSVQQQRRRRRRVGQGRRLGQRFHVSTSRCFYISTLAYIGSSWCSD